MYEWNETEQFVEAAVRDFVDAEIRPHIDALEDGTMSPYPLLRKLFATFGIDAMARESVEKMLAKQADREAGKQAERTKSSGGGDAMAAQQAMMLIMTKELTKVSMGLCSIMGVSIGLGASTIMARGTLAQKKRWLPELVTLEKIAAWALTEPDSGSDAFGGMKTSVRRDGADYILNGQKTFITNGPDADVIVVYAKLDEGDGADKRRRKVLTFVLDSGMQGLTQGKRFKKMGINSSPTGELFFDNVRLTPDRLLGETENHGQGDGRESAKSGFVQERVGLAVLSLGVIEECLRVSLDYAKKRELWGKPISDFQLIQLKLAKMEVARVNVQNMLFKVLAMQKDGKTPSLAEASAMKWYASEAATDVAMDAVQLFGGNGYMREYRVEQLARDAKSLMIYAGANEVQITHVAKGLLRA
ncbi:acyl-CoA dehydrogenase family protein [Smaragdicoccus niigatensis]|uniref:acyl-CoA dehydrogenase family protein n=1 Tax=Smaragdicoccus niigatensis TaxID=359359 RepID=UPI00037C5F1B|nr:acyl-CoA dehydrogenase family protein [Smaragdicoccus niigatensis]